MNAASPGVRAEAAAWIARLHGGRRSPEMEAGLQRWLKADPAHARAFESATEAWDLGGALPSSVLVGLGRGEQSSWRAAFTTRRAAIAASLALIAVTGAFLLRDPAVSTSIGEQRGFTLEDGTRVVLNTASRLTVDYDDGARQVTLADGEAWFDVARDVKRPFVVIAGNRYIKALGTSFFVRRDAGAVAVTLVEGKVSIGGAAEPAVTLTPGQRLTMRATGATQVDQPPMEEISAWQRGEVVLDHTRLADAIEEMNRYSPTRLSLASVEVADIRVSGVFRAGDSARFAEAVADTYRLKLVRSEGGLVITGTPRSSKAPSGN